MAMAMAVAIVGQARNPTFPTPQAKIYHACYRCLRALRAVGALIGYFD